MNARHGAQRDLSTLAASARLTRKTPVRYPLFGSMWALGHAFALITGFVMKLVFDRLGGGQPAYSSALSLLAVYVAAEMSRAAFYWGASAGWPAWWEACIAWVRANLLHSVLVAPGAPSNRLPGSAGEAMGRVRDDVIDLVNFVDIWVDIVGAVVYTAIALTVMYAISPAITLAAVVPLVGVLVGTVALAGIFQRTHLRQREQGSSVTGLVADLFSGVLAIKTSGAEARAMDLFRRRNAERGRAAITAQLTGDVMITVSRLSVDITIGLVLLLGAAAMRQGSFSVGDLALFVAYAQSLTELPRWLGRVIGRHREARVALHRLARMHSDRSNRAVLAPAPVYIHRPPPPLAAPPPLSEGLRSFEVSGLTAVHGESGRGVDSVSFVVAPGSLTVITGSVGAGKTTLLRAALGLLPVVAGEVRWNGVAVREPSTQLVPPLVAYAGQVPRLFSTSLEENLRLGWPVSDAVLAGAIADAQMEPDVSAMPSGLATLVGARGSRLSGGQSQRASIARALVRTPELLVVDDMSSALDLATEDALWETFRTRGITCLAASHRRAALSRADQIVVLDSGRVVATGTLAELLESSPEFARLWSAELFEESEA